MAATSYNLINTGSSVLSAYTKIDDGGAARTDMNGWKSRRIDTAKLLLAMKKITPAKAHEVADKFAIIPLAIGDVVEAVYVRNIVADSTAAQMKVGDSTSGVGYIITTTTHAGATNTLLAQCIETCAFLGSGTAITKFGKLYLADDAIVIEPVTAAFGTTGVFEVLVKVSQAPVSRS